MIFNPVLQYDTVQWNAVLTLALACNSFHFFIGSESYPLLTNNFISSFLGLFSVKHEHSRNEKIYHTSKAQILLPIELHQGFFCILTSYAWICPPLHDWGTSIIISRVIIWKPNQISYHCSWHLMLRWTLNVSCKNAGTQNSQNKLNKFLNKKQIYQSISKPQS